MINSHQNGEDKQKSKERMREIFAHHLSAITPSCYLFV